jgi:glycosyltransferase involved in cell wall biosynthesis
MRFTLRVHNFLTRAAQRLGPWQHSPPNHEFTILLTGRFEAENWARAHLKPLADSKYCRHLLVVTRFPLSPIPGIITIAPPRWQERIFGKTAARLLTLAWTAWRKRPDIIGGFGLFPNGLIVTILAPLVGARAMYFCVGGPIEILDGGIYTESGPLPKMGTPDLVVENRLTQAVSFCDLVITMGTRAAEYFRLKKIPASIYVVSGGIDRTVFEAVPEPPSIDMVFVGRLTEIKRVDLFLKIVKKVTEILPTTTAAVVGDGPLRAELETLARTLGIEKNVQFAGHRRNISEWLGKSKLFLLTSRSEGLSLALMEAMMCGLPAVVSNVGDLGDLVEDGVNGFLINKQVPEPFAERILELLTDEEKWKTFSRAARQTALKNETSTVSRHWDEILSKLE